MWQARIHRSLPRLVADYPQARFLFATFTVKNCDVHLLRYTLRVMCQGWKRLTELKVFPAIGWVRSVEVTRGRAGDAHPHFHSLLMVQPEYFKAGYLKQPEWAELWRQCSASTTSRWSIFAWSIPTTNRGDGKKWPSSIVCGTSRPRCSSTP